MVAKMDPMQVSKILTDEYTIKILTAAYREPVSAYDLCLMYDIPIVRCFSVLKQLDSLDLLHQVRSVPQSNGNLRTYYRSRVKSATITIENGHLKVKLDWDEGEISSERHVDVMQKEAAVVSP
jgi:hypothetical protein